MSNKSFWKTMEELLTRKGNFSSDFINIEKHGELTNKKRHLVKIDHLQERAMFSPPMNLTSKKQCLFTICTQTYYEQKNGSNLVKF